MVNANDTSHARTFSSLSGEAGIGVRTRCDLAPAPLATHSAAS